jgi:hypothetical protein
MLRKKLGSLGWISEKTWMEKLSGVGSREVYAQPSVAKYHNFRFQGIITLIGIFTLRILALTAW